MPDEFDMLALELDKALDPAWYNYGGTEKKTVSVAAALLRARVGPLVAALESVEWEEQVDFWGCFCAWCGNGSGYGHAPDCQRQLALAAWNKPSIDTPHESR